MRFQNQNNVRQRNGRVRAAGRGRYRGKGRAAVNLGSQELLPPPRLVPFAHFTHTCLEDIVCQVDLVAQVPYFNAPVFLERGEQLGKVDEIFGTMESLCVSLRLFEPLRARQFEQGQVFFIEPQKLLPQSRFLPKTVHGKEKQQQASRKSKSNEVGPVLRREQEEQPRPRFSSGRGRWGVAGGSHDGMISRKYKNKY